MGKKDHVYKQCRMDRPTETGRLEHTAWIPSQFAKVGRNIQIKNSSDEWSDWTVRAVGGTQNFEHLSQQVDSQREFAHKLSYKKDRRTK